MLQQLGFIARSSLAPGQLSHPEFQLLSRGKALAVTVLWQVSSYTDFPFHVISAEEPI